MTQEATKERKKYSELTERQKELSRARGRRYYARNKDRINKKHRETPITPAQKKAKALWEKSKKGKLYRAIARVKRRALLKRLSELDKFCLAEAYRLCKLREKYTNMKWEIDHIVPISKGGTNKYYNIQVVPAVWNRRKYNTNTDKFFGATQGEV